MNLKRKSENNRIIVFCPYYPPHVGGLESHAQEWNTHMAERGYRIMVFTPHLPDSAEEYEIEQDGVEVIRFPAFELIPNFPVPKWWSMKYWRQRKRALQDKPDVVLSRTRFFLMSVMAMWYAKTRRIPWMHVEHGSGYVELNNRFFKACARIYDHTIGRMVLSYADHVVANSKASAAFVKRLAPRKNPTVIYRGVNREHIEAVPADATIRQQYGEQIILFVGRLIDGKGVPDLISAMKEIPNGICLIVGDGPQRQELELLVRSYDLSDRIFFLGHKAPNDLYGIMKSVDVMVNPSYTEGIPTAVIEAAFCRVPVVATDVGGTNEIIENGKSGILVSPRNPAMMAEAVQATLGDSHKRNEYADVVFSHVCNTFCWEYSVTKYISLLNSNHVSDR